MSRLMDSFLKLLFSSGHSTTEKASEGIAAKRRSRSRRGRGRSTAGHVGRRGRFLQYADSFIFLPSEESPRNRANTISSDQVLSSSSNSQPPSRLSLLKSRISQEVEDASIPPSTKQHSFQEPLYHRLSDFDPNHLVNETKVTGEDPVVLHRPLSCHSLGRIEYATPSDCIQPTRRYYYSEEDLDSVSENQGLIDLEKEREREMMPCRCFVVGIWLAWV